MHINYGVVPPTIQIIRKEDTVAHLEEAQPAFEHFLEISQRETEGSNSRRASQLYSYIVGATHYSFPANYFQFPLTVQMLSRDMRRSLPGGGFQRMVFRAVGSEGRFLEAETLWEIPDTLVVASGLTTDILVSSDDPGKDVKDRVKAASRATRLVLSGN